MKLAPLTAALAIAILSTAPVARASAPTAERIAVVVGANAAAPGRKPLRFAHKDAERVADVLELAGFSRDSIHVLRDPTPETLLETLDDTLERAASNPSMLVFYYSGHADARALFPGGQPLPLADLRKRLDSTNIAVRVGIIDACRGGGWTGAKGLSETEPFLVNVPLSLDIEGSVLISSSSGLEDAHESEHLQGSFFTHHWNAALRGAADDNEDGTVSLVEAFEYARRLTVRDTALYVGQAQHPSFRMNLRGKDDLALVRTAASTSVLAVRQTSGPLQLVHLESGMMVLELPAGERSVRLSVPPGRYLLRRDRGDRTYAREVVVRPGRVTEVREENLALVGSPRLSIKGTERRGNEPEPPEELGSWDLSFRLGLGWMAFGPDPGGLAVAVSTQIGYRAHPQLQILAAADNLGAEHPTDDGDPLSQDLASFGLRWHPFAAPTAGDSFTAPANLSLRTAGGYAHRYRRTGWWITCRDDYESGPAAVIGAEWRSTGTGFGLEISDVISSFADRISHSVTFNLVLF